MAFGDTRQKLPRDCHERPAPGANFRVIACQVGRAVPVALYSLRSRSPLRGLRHPVTIARAKTGRCSSEFIDLSTDKFDADELHDQFPAERERRIAKLRVFQRIQFLSIPHKANVELGSSVGLHS